MEEIKLLEVDGDGVGVHVLLDEVEGSPVLCSLRCMFEKVRGLGFTIVRKVRKPLSLWFADKSLLCCADNFVTRA